MIGPRQGNLENDFRVCTNMGTVTAVGAFEGTSFTKLTTVVGGVEPQFADVRPKIIYRYFAIC